MNTHFEELIAKYLRGTLNEDEKRSFALMLRNPENQLYLASRIDQQFTDGSLDTMVDEEVTREIYQQIRQKLHVEIKPQTLPDLPQEQNEVVHMAWHKKKSFRLAMAVAASLILLIGAGLIFFDGSNTGKAPVAVQTIEKRTNPALVNIHHEVNTTGREKRVQLPDGSLIVLADKSELDYREPFTDKRELTLKGKAYFKVVKNSSKPFTVFSGAVSTTALGTEFTVTAFGNTSQVIVRLYEGKVVIKPVLKDNSKLKKEVYLLPGEQFVYGSKAVTRMKSATAEVTPEDILIKELPADNPSIPQDDEGSWYMFNNQSLDQVFDQLEVMFNVEIEYNKDDIKNIYFTGKYKGSFPLENTLKEIAILHDLTITRKDNSYIISK